MHHEVLSNSREMTIYTFRPNRFNGGELIFRDFVIFKELFSMKLCVLYDLIAFDILFGYLRRIIFFKKVSKHVIIN